jgi:DNA repair protein RadC
MLVYLRFGFMFQTLYIHTTPKPLRFSERNITEIGLRTRTPMICQKPKAISLECHEVYHTTMSILDRPTDERPREKLQAKGAAILSDYELLMAMIGSGTAQADVTAIAKRVHTLINEKGSLLTYDDLVNITGLGAAKATLIMASFELWRRQFEVTDRPIIDSPEAAVRELAFIRNKKQEYFVCLTLDGANRLIAKRVITIGTLTASLVHPREVFADAITDRAACIVVAHNHPSGNLEPSKADLEVTSRLADAGRLLGITLRDHIIIANNEFFSIKS